ncbi:hypothetical protein BN946_scf185033.g35 [Trametes cinnabarina]|uniref:Uncharacterized protein n=1 Tax=Pycnoporus cinnabarinus TaxID=5643 RepID=A0A060SWI5_PYCCI|nr:hypothetical protein BN946_scf185033.g35 [Trametes cinnabarina]
MSTPAEESNQNTTHQPLGGVVAHGAVVDQFAAYPFATDEEFQQGLAGILASGALEGKSEEERAEILLRSEVFYFNRRTGSSLTMEDARRARQLNLREAVPPHDRVTVNPSTTATLNGREEEPQMLSFAQLKALIEQGRTDEIPNNKVIPNVLSSESPSESRAPPRKKPWEVSASA